MFNEKFIGTNLYQTIFRIMKVQNADYIEEKRHALFYIILEQIKESPIVLNASDQFKNS
jgi:hypothetical protein